MATVGGFSVLLAVVVFLCLSSHASYKKPQDRHIIVVGGGLAGLSAAVQLIGHSTTLTLIEGEKGTGGNSAKATSGINGCETETQKKLGVRDSHDKFYGDTMKAGKNENNADLVDVLVHKSAESIEFLMKMGVDLSDLNIGGGHSVPRTHWIPSAKEGKPKPVGVAIMRAIFERIEFLHSSLQSLDLAERVKILLSTTVVDLLTEDGKVVGVKVRDTDGEREIRGDAVILATGGFSNDHTDDSLLDEFASEFKNYPTTNGAFARGSGVKMARKIGAGLLHMDVVQIHPTGFVDPADPKAATKFLAAEALRGSGAILLNQDGKRFANELGTRDYLTAKIKEHCTFNETANAHTAYMLLNKAAVDKFGQPSFNFYWKVKKFFQEVNDVYDLAEITRMPIDNLKETFTKYGKEGATDEFEKKLIPVKFAKDETLYFATMTPVLHYTIGGLAINTDAQVLDTAGHPIVGLYAAGEVTGGVHGSNRLSGNSLLECVVFGRVAADHAALK